MNLVSSHGQRLLSWHLVTQGPNTKFLVTMARQPSLSKGLFISTSSPWIIANIVGSAAKIVVTWKTRNIYGAALMSITSNLIDIFIQIL